MRKVSTLAMFVLALSLAAAHSQAPDATIEGTWALTGANAPDGKKIPDELIAMLKGKMEFARDGTYVQFAMGKKVESGKYKVDASEKPATIDLDIQDGDNKGKVQLGIFKIEAGGKMTVALAREGSKDRPKDFEVGPDVEVSTYKREK